jgi:hypothetical protein
MLMFVNIVSSFVAAHYEPLEETCGVHANFCYVRPVPEVTKP